MSDQHPYYKFSKYSHLVTGEQQYISLHKLGRHEAVANPEIKLEYKLNQYGFRTKDWTDNKDECYMALGCSNTLGIGTPEENRWSNLVEEHTGVTVYNLGIGGGAPDTVTRLLLGWVDEIKPTKVFVLWPNYNRWELGKSDRIALYLPSTVSSIVNSNNTPKKFGADYLMQYLGEDFNSEINMIRNNYTLKGICEERNIDCYALKVADFRHTDLNNARDGKHNGALFQKAIADEFINLLEQ